MPTPVPTEHPTQSAPTTVLPTTKPPTSLLTANPTANPTPTPIRVLFLARVSGFFFNRLEFKLPNSSKSAVALVIWGRRPQTICDSPSTYSWGRGRDVVVYIHCASMLVVLRSSIIGFEKKSAKVGGGKSAAARNPGIVKNKSSMSHKILTGGPGTPNTLSLYYYFICIYIWPF